jgi:hypothetical protein
MFENVSHYKQAYSNLNTSQNDIVSDGIFDDEVANNIKNQFNFVKTF